MTAGGDPHYYDIDAVVFDDTIIHERVVRYDVLRPVLEVHPLEGLILAQLVCRRCGEQFKPTEHLRQKQHAEAHASE